MLTASYAAILLNANRNNPAFDCGAIAERGETDRKPIAIDPPRFSIEPGILGQPRYELAIVAFIDLVRFEQCVQPGLFDQFQE